MNHGSKPLMLLLGQGSSIRLPVTADNKVRAKVLCVQRSTLPPLEQPQLALTLAELLS